MSTHAAILRDERVRPIEALSGARAIQARDAALTFATLLLFGSVGGLFKARFGLALPGPVLGIVLLAAALAIVEWRSPRLCAAFHAACAPTARRLLAHMGLLFVPAGAGIVTEYPTLRHAGAALGAGVTVSALVGVLVTYFALRLFARRGRSITEERADTVC